MSVENIDNESFEEEVLNSQKDVLIDFYADWCGPCQMLAPIVEEVANENKNIKVCRINVDDNQELAMKYEVMSIPTLVVIKEGKEIKRKIGLISKDEILEMLGK